MDVKRSKKSGSTIFRLFLFPLIAIMLVQSAITIGTLVVRRIAGTLEEYSGSMMNRLVENRRVILQNDIDQKWSAVCAQEPLVNELLQQFLQDEELSLSELLRSGEQKELLLEQLFPECLNFLQNSSVTGTFLVLAGTTPGEPGDFNGFFVRDSDPATNTLNRTDLLLERGSKQLSRIWDIPLDTGWTSRFHMNGLEGSSADSYFYEPWRAGTEHPDADASDLGYWSLPFTLGNDSVDSYQMITYSVPLRYDGRVYGVLGVEISCRQLNGYFPVAELNGSQQSGYMLAVRQDDGSYLPLAGKGVLYSQLCGLKDSFMLRETTHDGLSLVEGAKLDGQGIYAVVCPLRMYGNNVPYDNTEWALLGLNLENDLLGMGRRLYLWMVIAVFVGLSFGILCIYVLVRHLTRPLQHLMHCVSGGSAGLQKFQLSNILEIDALYNVVRDLTERQKEAENILLEEKERYKVALESSNDIFFSYDVQSQMLDLVNHKTMSGQWQCPQSECGFINPDYIYEADRVPAMESLQKNADDPHAEFRIRWPHETEFTWVALSGKTVYDTDGRRWKIVGSIRNIQEQKEREAEQLRKNTTDAITGLYVFSAGMERLSQCRKEQPEGVVVSLSLDGLQKTNEKNGIVFGDMILEEIGDVLQQSCRAFEEKTGGRTVSLRLNQNEFVLWLGACTENQALKFVAGIQEQTAARFNDEILRVPLSAGFACGERQVSNGELICRAKLARSLALSGEGQVPFYEKLPRERRAGLPPLQPQETNSLGYDKNTSLASVALNLFGKGADFPAQMLLMLQKIGRFCQADGVLVTMLQADYNSNYLNYQWHPGGGRTAETVRKYTQAELKAFTGWLGEAEVRCFSEQDSRRSEIQCFLSVAPGQRGLVLPMYDGGSYMGNLCIFGDGQALLEAPDFYQSLTELGRVIQSQLNQQQHDIASRAKSEFLSRMSHEIRTPMNGIIGMTAIAMQQGQAPERIMDCLQKIQSSSNYLLGLINDILDMSKIESGKMKLVPANFNLDEMLATIREVIAPQAAEKEIAFTQKIDLRHHWFAADQMRISQVLINLLGNAVKFTPARGRIVLTVREEPETGNGIRVFFAVSDTGVGIAREDRNRVFRSFEQAAGRDPSKQQGTGLGLSISSRLVQLMGSTIHLESAPGEGSTFSFTIPLAEGEDEKPVPEAAEISFEGYSVLVVEDNELNAEIAQCLLEERGFRVDCVHDGAQAVERIRTTKPGTYDLILMDIMMPVMNGLEAAVAIRNMEREDCRSLPIIAMSANAFDDDLKKSVECGMNGHLSKPVEVDKLYGMLDRVLRNPQ